MASLAFLAFVASTYAPAQRGALTTPESIDELTQQSTLIVHGYVTSAKVEPHPQFRNLMTVLVTMNVEDTLKGSSQKNLQFRQYIWDIRDQLDAAKYAKKQELLLMLGAHIALRTAKSCGTRARSLSHYARQQGTSSGRERSREFGII